MTGYRRRGTPTEPRTQDAVIERHVRAPWSLPLFASLTTLAFVLVTAIPPNSPAEAEAQAPGSPDPGQSILVAGEHQGSDGRGDYSVTDPPKASAPASGFPDPGTAKAIAYELVAARGWSTNEYDCLVALWTRESQWNVYAENPTSGAYGIPQALPGDKMATAGSDWATNPRTQIRWGLGYIAGRYGTPCGAWAHSESVGWY
ncbi:MAG TPA: lytic transglycosylase domain-containing protein [Pseudolysinimonas sp.]